MVKKVLCLDGGGCRGVITVKILDMIEKHYNIRVADYFDMFVGTSTGALIATLFAYNKLSAEEILNTVYTQQNIAKIFTKSYMDKIFGLIQFVPKYSDASKLELINKYLCEGIEHSTNVLLNDVEKPVLIVSYDPSIKKPMFFRNYFDGDDYLLNEVCNSTSAAPGYFPAVKVTNKTTNENMMLIDGGVCANNPCMMAYGDAKELFPDEFVKLLSVGTGIVKCTDSSYQYYGGIEWAMSPDSILDLLMDANQLMAHITCEESARRNEDTYIRINERLTIASDELDNSTVTNYNNLLREAELWWENNTEKLNDFFD